METLGQPLHKPGLGCGQVHTGHANLGESQLPGPGLYLRDQLVAVKVRAVDRHLPIVESLLWRDEQATCDFAQALARQAALSHLFIALHGDLGSGKTTLVRHLLRALGVAGRIKSPTYAVVETYETADFNVWHFDFYRLSDPQEWEDAGFRDIFAGPGLKLAEWPDKAAGFLPQADLDLWLQTDPKAEAARQVRLVAHTATGALLLAGVSADTNTKTNTHAATQADPTSGADPHAGPKDGTHHSAQADP